MNLSGRKVLLGITGSIAAYKAISLLRLLQKEGVEVKVVLTSAAKDFVTPLTLSALSGYPVYHQPFDPITGEWVSHIELGLWADVLVIAPASANTISKLAYGQSDNLLTTIYLSARCPVLLAPAMDLDMYAHKVIQENLTIVTNRGIHLVEAKEGYLASRLEGKGRMAEPEEIVERVSEILSQNQLFQNKKVLLTAGPTQEPLDPVRFIGNHSSGKMGYLMAEELLKSGAEVLLISGPTSLEKPSNVTLIKVQTALEMYQACNKHFDSVDLAIFAAAVADYRPSGITKEKIKKNQEDLAFKMVRNPDIAAEMGRQKKNHQYTIGFALETENEEDNARRKMAEKNLDMIILNSLRDEGAGFGHDTNKVTIFKKDNSSQSLPLQSKRNLAKALIYEVASLLD